MLLASSAYSGCSSRAALRLPRRFYWLHRQDGIEAPSGCVGRCVEATARRRFDRHDTRDHPRSSRMKRVLSSRLASTPGSSARRPCAPLNFSREYLRADRAHARGLTFFWLELLVVIVLIGLLATVGAQAIPGDGRRLQRATDHVEHQLRMARLHALKTGSSVNIPCNELTAPRQAASVRLNEDSAVPGSCIGSKGPAVGVTFFCGRIVQRGGD